jgi:PKD repeat protein
MTGGNGVGGRNETSVNLATTWSTTNPAVPPFVKGNVPPPPGQLRAVPGGPYQALVGEAISFNGSASTPATGGTIVSYLWDFGDSETASGAVVNHAYDAPGTYTVSLTVTGSGTTGTDTRTTTATIRVPSEGALQIPAQTFIPSIGERMTITLDVEAGKWQLLRVYDLEGREVRVLVDAVSTGKTNFTWDGRDEELMLVPAGTYICHLEARDESGNVSNFTGPIVVARRLERN